MKFLDEINEQMGRFVRWLVLAMVLFQFAIVVLRYVFSFSSIALTELVLYFHATLIMLSAGYALLHDKHVRVDIFYSGLSERAKTIIDICGHLFFVLPSMTVLLVMSWPSVRNSWSILEGPISVGGIPASFYLKSLITAFSVLIIIQSVSILIGKFRAGGAFSK